MSAPLPAGSRKLRDRRYHVDVCTARNERGAYLSLAEGRFADLEAAKRWADEVHPDAYLVTVTYFSALSGWRPQHSAKRVEGAWQ
jgi:hypothetical protein